jgi:hypothetical protein
MLFKTYISCNEILCYGMKIIYSIVVIDSVSESFVKLYTVLFLKKLYAFFQECSGVSTV